MEALFLAALTSDLNIVMYLPIKSITFFCSIEQFLYFYNINFLISVFSRRWDNLTCDGLNITLLELLNFDFFKLNSLSWKSEKIVNYCSLRTIYKIDYTVIFVVI